MRAEVLVGVKTWKAFHAKEFEHYFVHNKDQLNGFQHEETINSVFWKCYLAVVRKMGGRGTQPMKETPVKDLCNWAAKRLLDQNSVQGKPLPNLRIWSPPPKRVSRVGIQQSWQIRIKSLLLCTASAPVSLRASRGLSFKAGLLAKMSSLGGVALQPEFISPVPRSDPTYSPKLSLQAPG